MGLKSIHKNAKGIVNSKQEKQQKKTKNNTNEHNFEVVKELKY